MAAKKKITEFLPPPPEEQALVQGHVTATLRQQVAEQMQRDKAAGIKTTWDNLLDASLRAYLAERES